MEDIKLNGNFAVKVGNLWVKKDYNEYSLSEQPKSLVEFKAAYDIANKVGGKVFMFKPVEIDDEKIEDLKMAAGLAQSGTNE